MSETTGRIDREKKRLRALPYMGPEAGWDEVLTLIDDHDRLEEALATAIRETREGSPDWEKLWEEQSERAEALQAERDRLREALIGARDLIRDYEVDYQQDPEACEVVADIDKALGDNDETS